MQQRSMRLSVARMESRRLQLIGGVIRGVTVLNNTPAFLFIGLGENPSRENCLFEVAPFSNASFPADAPEGLYITVGPHITRAEANSTAFVQWGEQPQPLNVTRVHRTLEFVLATAVALPAGNYANGVTFARMEA